MYRVGGLGNSAVFGHGLAVHGGAAVGLKGDLISHDGDLLGFGGAAQADVDLGGVGFFLECPDVVGHIQLFRTAGTLVPMLEVVIAPDIAGGVLHMAGGGNQNITAFGAGLRLGLGGLRAGDVGQNFVSCAAAGTDMPVAGLIAGPGFGKVMVQRGDHGVSLVDLFHAFPVGKVLAAAFAVPVGAVAAFGTGGRYGLDLDYAVDVRRFAVQGDGDSGGHSVGYLHAGDGGERAGDGLLPCLTGLIAVGVPGDGQSGGHIAVQGDLHGFGQVQGVKGDANLGGNTGGIGDRSHSQGGGLDIAGGVDPEAVGSAALEGDADIAGKAGEGVGGGEGSLAACHVVHGGGPVDAVGGEIDGIGVGGIGVPGQLHPADLVEAAGVKLPGGRRVVGGGDPVFGGVAVVAVGGVGAVGGGGGGGRRAVVQPDRVAHGLADGHKLGDLSPLVGAVRLGGPEVADPEIAGGGAYVHGGGDVGGVVLLVTVGPGADVGPGLAVQRALEGEGVADGNTAGVAGGGPGEGEGDLADRIHRAQIHLEPGGAHFARVPEGGGIAVHGQGGAAAGLYRAGGGVFAQGHVVGSAGAADLPEAGPDVAGGTVEVNTDVPSLLAHGHGGPAVGLSEGLVLAQVIAGKIGIVGDGHLELVVARHVKDDFHFLHGVYRAQVCLPPVLAVEGVVAGVGDGGAPLGAFVAVVGVLRLFGVGLAVPVDRAGGGGLVEEDVHRFLRGVGVDKAGLVGVAAGGNSGQAVHRLGGDGDGTAFQTVGGGGEGDVALAPGGADPHGPLTAPDGHGLLADDKAGSVGGKGNGVVGGVDHSAVFVLHVHPHQLGGAAVQLEGVVILSGEGNLGGSTGGAAGKFRYRRAVQIGHGLQGTLAGGIGGQVKGEGGMGQILGAHISAGVGGGIAGGIVGIAVRRPHQGIGGLTGDERTVQIERHFVAVAENADLIGGVVGPGVGDKDHGAAVQAVLAQVHGGVGLALEEVSAEFGDTGHVHHAAEGELVHVKAGVVGVIPIGGGAVPALAPVEGEGGLDVVALDEHPFVAALGVGIVLGLPGDPGGGVKAAEVPVAVLADHHRLLAVSGGVSHHVGLGRAHADVKDVPIGPAAGVGFGVAHLGVLLLHQIVHILGPLGGVAALVEAGLPGHHGAVVAVDPDLVPHLLIGVVLEGVGVGEILPAGQTVQHRHTVPVAGFVEGGVVGVMAHADKIEAIFPQPLDLGKDGVVALGVAQHVGLRVEVDAHQLHPLIVDVAAVPLPFHLADAVGGVHRVFDRPVHEEGGADGVELRGVGGPEPGLCHGQVLGEGILCAAGHRLGVLRRGHHRGAVGVDDLGAEGEFGVAAAAVFHLRLGVDGGALLGDGGGGEEHAAAGHGAGRNGIGDVDQIGDGQIHVTVKAAEVLEIGVDLAGGKGGVGPGIQPDRQHVFPMKIHLVGNIKGELSVAALMDPQLLPVEPYRGLLHGALKGEEELLPLHGRVHGEVPPVPEDAQIFLVIGFRRVLDGAVGGVNVQPLAVVQGRVLGVGPVAGVESPVVVEAEDGPAVALRGGGGRSGQREEAHRHGHGQEKGQGAAKLGSHNNVSFHHVCGRNQKTMGHPLLSKRENGTPGSRTACTAPRRSVPQAENGIIRPDA